MEFRDVINPMFDILDDHLFDLNIIEINIRMMD